MRYDPSKAGSIAELIAPPYDVISSEAQQALLDRHPANFVRLEYGKHGGGSDRYESARDLLESWLRGGILIEDETPALYVYEQTFQLPETQEERRRLKTFAAVRLEPWGGSVYPHERTLTAPKQDRMRLMEACRANLSPILGVAQDPKGAFNAALREAADGADPIVDAADDLGQRHRLWRVDEAAAVSRIQSAFGGTSVTIADGHHRYETSLAYQQRHGARHTSGDADYTLMGVVSSGSEDLAILPIHRLASGVSAERLAELPAALERSFHVQRRRVDERLPDAEVDFSLYLGGGELLDATLREESRGALSGLPPALAELSVSKLHAALLRDLLGVDTNEEAGQRQVSYTARLGEALEKVRSGEAQLAALTRPIAMEEVERAARAGVPMPQKSTYFYPKLPSGLAARRLH